MELLGEEVDDELLGEDIEDEPLGEELMLDEPLGDALLLELVSPVADEELDGLLELDVLFELVLLGEALEVLADELSCEVLPEPETPSAVRVCESRLPVALMPCCCWNCLSAARVCGPILPSAFTFMPLSLSACCAWRMLDESADPDCDDMLLLANATVLDSTSAASVILRRSIFNPFNSRGGLVAPRRRLAGSPPNAFGLPAGASVHTI